MVTKLTLELAIDESKLARQIRLITPLEYYSGQLTEEARKDIEGLLSLLDEIAMQCSNQMPPPVPPDSWYSVTVECSSSVYREDWHIDDLEENPLGLYRYTVSAKDDEEAKERALAQFHSEVPIGDLENFSVIAQIGRAVAPEPPCTDPDCPLCRMIGGQESLAEE